MTGFEVKDHILNSQFEKPKSYWQIEEGKESEEMPGRRPAMYFYRPPGSVAEGNGIGTAIELKLVNRIRNCLDEWRKLALKGEGGVTRTTMANLMIICLILSYA